MRKKITLQLIAFLIAMFVYAEHNVNAQSKKTKSITSKKSSSKRSSSYAAPATSISTETYNGHEVFTGPRGGKYYINKNGNKTYIKH